MRKICENNEIMVVATHSRIWAVRFGIGGEITAVYRVVSSYMNFPSNPYTPAAYCERRELIRWVMSPENRVYNWCIFTKKLWRWRDRI